MLFRRSDKIRWIFGLIRETNKGSVLDRFISSRQCSFVRFKFIIAITTFLMMNIICSLGNRKIVCRTGIINFLFHLTSFVTTIFIRYFINEGRLYCKIKKKWKMKYKILFSETLSVFSDDTVILRAALHWKGTKTSVKSTSRHLTSQNAHSNTISLISDCYSSFKLR